MDNYPTSFSVNFGQRILPLIRIQSFSPDEWEVFIEEWLEVKESKYKSIQRFGGAGDKGRDVVAFFDEDDKIEDSRWDCYQCKHYKDPLIPSKVAVEIGKILYYSFNGDYSPPENYFFIAPKDCGTSLSDFLTRPETFKEYIRDNWDKYCTRYITSQLEIPLKGDFLEYFEKFDFSIFKRYPSKDILEEHKVHNNHLTRFGGGLPARPVFEESQVPEVISKEEEVYVNKLIDAYNSTTVEKVGKVEELSGKFMSHFRRARISFHKAEQLRVLYRDNLPIGAFEDFQDEIYQGVFNLNFKTFDNQFNKVIAVEDAAVQIDITSNAYSSVCKTGDKIGVCHQLSNDNKLDWNNEQ